MIVDGHCLQRSAAAEPIMTRLGFIAVRVIVMDGIPIGPASTLVRLRQLMKEHQERGSGRLTDNDVDNLMSHANRSNLMAYDFSTVVRSIAEFQLEGARDSQWSWELCTDEVCTEACAGFQHIFLLRDGARLGQPKVMFTDIYDLLVRRVRQSQMTADQAIRILQEVLSAVPNFPPNGVEYQAWIDTVSDAQRRAIFSLHPKEQPGDEKFPGSRDFGTSF